MVKVEVVLKGGEQGEYQFRTLLPCTGNGCGAMLHPDHGGPLCGRCHARKTGQERRFERRLAAREAAR